jgi:hypothetical protein
LEEKTRKYLALLLPFDGFFRIIRIPFYPLFPKEAVMKKIFPLFVLLLIVGVGLAACGGGGTSSDDLLEVIKDRGYMVVSTDPNYEPQSFLDPTADRAAGTVCSRPRTGTS